MVTHVLQEFSSVGRASVSKTEGRGFESPNSCHFSSYRRRSFLPLCSAATFRKSRQIRLPIGESVIKALVFPKWEPISLSTLTAGAKALTRKKS